jgi:SAM-dependent methyltransferase
MTKTDAERWNTRYLQDDRYSTFIRPRPFLVENAQFLPKRGLALDVAMGLGGNAGYLLEQGLRVVGVDISSVAVMKARQRLPDLMAVVADLNAFYIPDQSFDAILNFYFLQRDLWQLYQRALRPGGVLFLETLTQEMLNIQPDMDPAYLLAPDELRKAFADWEILVYREGWEASRGGHLHPVASLVARIPYAS